MLEIDFVRGIALFGILVMNIQSFAMPHAGYFNPSLFDSLAGGNALTWSLTRSFFDLKFLNIFATLFGASLVLSAAKVGATRRHLWLAAFGLMHGYLLWFGDILFTYGVVGLVARRALAWRVRNVLYAAGLLAVMSVLLPAVGYVAFAHLPGAIADQIREHYEGAGAAVEAAAFRGSYVQQFAVRARIAFDSQLSGTFLETGWRAGACMLCGIALVRSNLLQQRQMPRWVPAALVLGAVLTAMGLVVQWRTAFAPRAWLLSQALVSLGSFGISAGYLCMFVRLAQAFHHTLWVRAVARLGRVALSAYLMQSIVGTLAFGGHGLGLYGTVSRTQLLVAAWMMWLVQVGLAWLWTARYRVGPFEALWRGLSTGDFSLGTAAESVV